jgi:glycosyltransferase involved in cell wall biosynthesis
MAKFTEMSLIIGIDAANIRGGGTVTHLAELLSAYRQSNDHPVLIYIWSYKKTLRALPDSPWIIKINPWVLNQGFIFRTLWQCFCLSNNAKEKGCNILLVPGGSYAGSFQPVVTMSQNLLPFEWGEIKRYGFSISTIRLLMLRYIQSWTFRRSQGIIFLTAHAKKVVTTIAGPLSAKTAIIPHGLSNRFFMHPKNQVNIEFYSDTKPYNILYVSRIEPYKHQPNLIKAVSYLRETYGWPLQLTLVGPAHEKSHNIFLKAASKYDPSNSWIKYCGDVPYESLYPIFKDADMGVFASTCENMPIILLELMGASLPIACSDRSPMQEILGGAGVYFNPEDSLMIAKSLHKLISLPNLRAENAILAHQRALNFSWDSCARDTFQFIQDISGV